MKCTQRLESHSRIGITATIEQNRRTENKWGIDLRNRREKTKIEEEKNKTNNGKLIEGGVAMTNPLDSTSSKVNRNREVQSLNLVSIFFFFFFVVFSS